MLSPQHEISVGPGEILWIVALLILHAIDEVETEPTAKQIEWIDWYRSCGNPAYVVYPADMDAIEAILRGNRVDIEEWWR